MIFVLAVSATDALAAEPDCRTIRDATERLKCYDREFPVIDADEAEVETAVVEREVEARAETTARSRQAPPVIESVPVRRPAEVLEPVADAEPVVQPRETERQRRIRLFGKRPERAPEPDIDAVTASVMAAEKTWPSGRWRYTLDNGQIWVQTRAKTTSVQVGDDVTVRKRRWTYYLLSERGASFGVERVE